MGRMEPRSGNRLLHGGPVGGLLGWGLQRGGNTELQDFSVCVFLCVCL